MKAGYLLPTTLSIRNLTLAEIITPENVRNDVMPGLPWKSAYDVKNGFFGRKSNFSSQYVQKFLLSSRYL